MLLAANASYYFVPVKEMLYTKTGMKDMYIDSLIKSSHISNINDSSACTAHHTNFNAIYVTESL